MYVTEMGPHIDKAQRNVLFRGDLVLSSFNCGGQDLPVQLFGNGVTTVVIP